VEVRLRLPRIPAGLFGNLLGVLALAAIAVCIGGFLVSLGVPGGWWVSGLIGGIELFALSWVASAQADVDAVAAAKALNAPTQQLRPVPAVAKSA
jgi:hypothetical protein